MEEKKKDEDDDFILDNTIQYILWFMKKDFIIIIVCLLAVLSCVVVYYNIETYKDTANTFWREQIKNNCVCYNETNDFDMRQEFKLPIYTELFNNES